MKFLKICSALTFVILYSSTAFAAQAYSEKPENIHSDITLDYNFIEKNNINALFSIDGEVFTDKYPIIENSFSLIPIRSLISEDESQWIKESKTLIINKDNKTVVLRVGSRIAEIDGIAYEMDIEPILANSTLYVPCRFIAEVFDYDVDYIKNAVEIDNSHEYIPMISLNKKSSADVNYIFEEKKGMTTYLTKIKSFENMSVNSNSKLIYNNFPERIMSNTFFETYLNKTENIKGNVRLFLSHGNDSKSDIDYIIRFENKSDEIVEVEYLKDVMMASKSTAEEIKHHSKNFYDKILQNNYSKISINPNEIHDFIIYNIPNANFFAGQYDFRISDDVDITTFILPSGFDNNLVETPDNPYHFDYQPQTFALDENGMNETGKYYTTYSGYIDGFKINAENNFKLSEMDFRKRNSAIGFETGGIEDNINHRNGISEFLDIILFNRVGFDNEINIATFFGNVPSNDYGGVDEINRPRNYCNLGNWGIEYNIKTTIENDTEFDKTISLNLVPLKTSVMIVQADNKVYSVSQDNSFLGHELRRENCKTYDVLDNSKNADTWEILSVDIPAGESKTVDYKYILGTDSMSNVFHIWQESN